MGHNIFYNADTHFHHRNIVKYEAKNKPEYPHTTTEERDNTIIDNWNANVKGNDEVYILGDFAYANQQTVIELLSMLRGKKHIVMGNHDKQWYRELAKYSQTKVKSVNDYLKINDNGRTVILSHYPIYAWDLQHRGSYHVYGHVHNSAEEDIFQQAGQLLLTNNIDKFRAMNAGCMVNDFAPATLDQMIERYGL